MIAAVGLAVLLLVSPGAMATDGPSAMGTQTGSPVNRGVATETQAPVVKQTPVETSARQGKAVDMAGKIIGVTLLPDGAWVTRRMDVSWSTHAAQIVRVLDLPRDIALDSVQVHADTMVLSAPMQWQDLSVEDSEAYRQIDRQIDTMTRQLDKANDALLAARTRLAIFQAQMSTTPTTGQQGARAGNFLTDTKSRGRFDRLLNTLIDHRRQAQSQVDAATKALAAARQKQAALRQKGPSRVLELPLVLDTDQKRPTTQTLTVRYRVKTARWVPVYRADLITKAEALRHETAAASERPSPLAENASTVRWSLVAEVRQTTGEDWDHVPVTLSLLDTRRYYPVPRLDRWTIGFSSAVRPAPHARPGLLREQAEMAATAAITSPGDETGFNAEFRSAAPVTIPSSENATVIPLLQHAFPAETTDLITPIVSPLAVLSARFTLNNASPLPAGVWQLFLNGTQIGRVHEPALMPLKDMTLGFGVDRRIEVTVDSPVDQRDENGLIGKAQQLVRRRVVTVQSHHQQPMPVTVLMNLPVAEDSEIAVDPLADNTPPSNKQYDGKEGVWAWSNQIKPDQKITINFGFRLRWPADKNLFGL